MNYSLLAILIGALATPPVGAPEPAPTPELVITARLVSIEEPRGCGVFHFGQVAVYSDIVVASGKWARYTVRVVHGCAELARQEYALEAGSLKEFKVGDTHRLELSTENFYKIGFTLKSSSGDSLADFYALKVDLETNRQVTLDGSPAGEVVPPNNSFERTRSAAAAGFAGSASCRAAQLAIR